MSTHTKKRVLLVEDDPRIVDSLVEALRQIDCDVSVVVRFEDVLESVVERPPHLAIVSLNLPRNSGYDICELIRGDDSLLSVQILIMSDQASPAAIAYAEDAGANAFLRKPFTRQQLQKYATALLDPHRPPRPSMRWLRRSESPPPVV